MKVIEKVFSLYDRFSNVHHGFVKALKMCIAILRVFQKVASRFMKVIQTCISFACALYQCASRVYENLKNAHLLFYESFKILQLDL